MDLNADLGESFGTWTMGHDAAVFANGGTPSAMIFVRNSHGSHNPDEAMAIEDFMCGVELMYAFISTGGRE